MISVTILSLVMLPCFARRVLPPCVCFVYLCACVCIFPEWRDGVLLQWHDDSDGGGRVHGEQAGEERHQVSQPSVLQIFILLGHFSARFFLYIHIYTSKYRRYFFLILFTFFTLIFFLYLLFFTKVVFRSLRIEKLNEITTRHLTPLLNFARLFLHSLLVKVAWVYTVSFTAVTNHRHGKGGG